MTAGVFSWNIAHGSELGRYWSSLEWTIAVDIEVNGNLRLDLDIIVVDDLGDDAVGLDCEACGWFTVPAILMFGV